MSSVKVNLNEYPRASKGLVTGTMLSFIGGVFLLMSLCSPYWIESYDESFSNFKNMGLWEYCFENYMYPFYQYPRYFNGCHNIFSREYYVIREWLVPGWLMAVQAFITLAFILTYFSLGVLALEIIRYPLKIVLQYEWIITRVCCICVGISSLFIFLAVAIFGGNAYRRDWLMYPKFNVLAWAYSLAVVSFMVLALAALVLLKEAQRAYEVRSAAKNLVMQMEMQEPGYHSHSRPHSRSTNQGGYI